MSSATQTPPAEKRRRWTRPAVVIPVIVVVIALLTAAALAFQPWKLFLNQSVDEAIPVAATTDGGKDAPAAGAAPAADPNPKPLLTGSFISHEHETSGTATILRLPDGSRVLRLEDLRTSNGPDLKVWLTDAPVIPGTDGWFVFDDGDYVDLGALKGNIGNQNYPIPADVDLKKLRSLSIWCDRFNVSFGAAELRPA